MVFEKIVLDICYLKLEITTYKKQPKLVSLWLTFLLFVVFGDDFVGRINWAELNRHKMNVHHNINFWQSLPPWDFMAPTTKFVSCFSKRENEHKISWPNPLRWNTNGVATAKCEMLFLHLNTCSKYPFYL